MKFKLFPVAILLAAGAVFAATTTPSWKNAIKNSDGTNIPATGQGALKSTTFEWSICGVNDTFTTRLGSVTNTTNLVPGADVTGPATSDLPPGRYCGRAYHINSYNSQGEYSDVVVKEVEAPKPGKPTNPSFG